MHPYRPQFSQSTLDFLDDALNTTINEDETLNISLSATDADGDIITYFADAAAKLITS